MDDKDIKQIKAWAATQAAPVTIYITETDHPEQNAFTAFAKAFTELAPQVAVHPWDKDAELPGLILSHRIHYSALPFGRELPPFLTGLSLLAEPEPALPEALTQALDQVEAACSLTLFIALACPHCPGMVETLIPLALASDKLRLHIIDGSLFPDTAQKDNVMSAPCLILDRDFRWTGSVTAEEILKMAARRDPAQLSAQTLRTILEQGDADWICREMIKKGEIFENFLELLIHPMWSVRLGAVVVVETLGEEAPELAEKICPPLMALFHEKEIPVQGDILYALGAAGGLDTMAWIRELAPALTHPDLKEAAEDAMEAIESRR